MGVQANPVWAEAVQIVPVVVLASSFLVRGEVDLSAAGPLFAVAAPLALVAHGFVAFCGHVQNPIALGAAAWLWLGAIVFGVGFAPGAAALAEGRGAGLFLCALALGIGLHAGSPTRYLGARSDDAAFLGRASASLLVLTAAAVAWSWTFRADLRLGSGLPFLLLNLARRATIARAG